MSLYRHPDPAIAAWLADGPADLSSHARRAISSKIRTTPQRRAIHSWVPTRRRSRLLIAGIMLSLALALAVAAGAVRLLLPQPTESPMPTASAQLSPNCGGGRSSVGIPGTKVWVDYCQSAPLAIHTGLGMGIVGFGSVPECLIDEPAVGERGVVVADVRGARRHGSVIEQPRIGTDAETFLRDLDVPLPYPPQGVVIDFEVDDVATTRLAGMTAWSARVAPTHVPWAAHLELFAGRGGCLEFGRPNTVWVFDIGQSIVLVQAWASDEGALTAWLPEATRFIDAFRFRSDGPTTSIVPPTLSSGPAN